MSSDRKPKKLRRFAVRTTLRFTLLIAISVALAAVGTYLALRHSLLRELDELLERDVSELQQHLNDPLWHSQLLLTELEHESNARASEKLFFRLFDTNGNILWTVPVKYKERLLPLQEQVREALNGHRLHLTIPVDEESDCLVLVSPLTVNGHSMACQIGASLAETDARLRKYALVLLAIWVAVVAGGAMVSYRSTQRPLNQLKAMTSCVRDISARMLHVRLPVGEMDQEFDELARTLNDMLQRLQDSVHRLDQFTADAAHELRSPVARLRMAAEVALDDHGLDGPARGSLEDIVGQADRLGSLVSRLLFLAREGSGQEVIDARTLSAAEVLEEAVALYEAVIDDKGLTLECGTIETAEIRGDRQRLLQALANLIENAIRHTPTGGKIGLEGRRADGQYCFIVWDTGCGIASKHLPHIFDRFYRADSSRHSEGAGLGLSIVQAIAKAHEGTVTADSEAGKGAIFSLRIPLLLSLVEQ